jgi:hypothetical protein
VPTLCLRLFRSWRLLSSPGGSWQLAGFAGSPHNVFPGRLLASPGGSCPLLSERVDIRLPKPKVAGPIPVARSTYKNDVGSSACPVPTRCLPSAYVSQLPCPEMRLFEGNLDRFLAEELPNRLPWPRSGKGSPGRGAGRKCLLRQHLRPPGPTAPSQPRGAPGRARPGKRPCDVVGPQYPGGPRPGGIGLPEPDRSASPAPSVDETVIAELWAKSIVPGMTPGMTIKPQASPSSAHYCPG